MRNSILSFILLLLYNLTLMSDKADAQWMQSSSGLKITGYVSCMSIYSGIIFAGTYGGGIYKSTDNGNNWVCSSNGLEIWNTPYNGSYMINNLFRDNNIIFAGTEYGIYKSTDLGSTWAPANNGIYVTSIYSFYSYYYDIYAVTSYAIYKSTDEGMSWAEVSFVSLRNIAYNGFYLFGGSNWEGMFRSSDGGSNWTDISSGLPLRWVTRVATDPYDEQIVYVTLSGYRYDSYLPHIFRSADGGDNWLDISGNLSEAPANDIIVDPALDSTLYLATDFGVFVTRDLGLNWSMLGDNLPNIPIVDLDFHQPTRTLIAATYGRSMYTFNVDQLVSVNSLNINNKYIIIYPNPTDRFINFNYALIHGDISYSIIDMNGQVVIQGNLISGRTNYSVCVTSLSSGFYFIKISDRDQEVSGKFLKR